MRPKPFEIDHYTVYAQVSLFLIIHNFDVSSPSYMQFLYFNYRDIERARDARTVGISIHTHGNLDIVKSLSRVRMLK